MSGWAGSPTASFPAPRYQCRMPRGALHQIDAFNGTPCSRPLHIARMREITISTRVIEEMGYFLRMDS